MVGFTGVMWFPRGATVNSLALYGGPGAAPMAAASASWAQLSGLFGEAAAVVAGVVGQLGAGWRGVAADVALADLAVFGAWLAETSQHAGSLSAAAAAEASAYEAAALVMPSPAEIAATRAAEAAVTVAAAPTGAGLGAATAAAETAEREMDIRAAMAMDGYEAASTVLSVPVPFRPAPPITTPGAQEASSTGTVMSELVRGARTVQSEAPAAVQEFLAAHPVDLHTAAQAATRAAGVAGQAVAGTVGSPVGPVGPIGGGAASAPVVAAGVVPAPGTGVVPGTGAGPGGGVSAVAAESSSGAVVTSAGASAPVPGAAGLRAAGPGAVGPGAAGPGAVVSGGTGSGSDVRPRGVGISGRFGGVSGHGARGFVGGTEYAGSGMYGRGGTLPSVVSGGGRPGGGAGPAAGAGTGTGTSGSGGSAGAVREMGPVRTGAAPAGGAAGGGAHSGSGLSGGGVPTGVARGPATAAAEDDDDAVGAAAPDIGQPRNGRTGSGRLVVPAVLGAQR